MYQTPNIKEWQRSKDRQVCKEKDKTKPCSKCEGKRSPEIITAQMQLTRVLEWCLLDYSLAHFIHSPKYYQCSWLMKHQVHIPHSRCPGMVSNFVYINKSLYCKNWPVNCLAWYVLWWCLTPWRNPSIMHSKGKREQHQWTEANKLVKEEFAEMNQLYYLLQEGHGNWPLPLHARQGVLSLGSEESALKSPSVTWPCPLHLRHASFVTPPHSSHKDLQQLLTNQNSPNLIRTLWAPVIWAKKQEMKKRVAM